VAFYAMKTIAPVGLSMIYPRWDLNAVSWLWALPGVAIGIFFGICWMFRGTWGKAPLFGLGYFIATLVPVLGFLNIYFMKFALVGDHYLYISIIGVIALVIGSVAWMLRRAPRGVRVMLGVIIVGALFILTRQRAHVFSDAVLLWTDAAARSPTSWVVYNNLGHAWIRLEHLNTDEGAKAFDESLRLDPDNQELKVALAWPPADLKTAAAESDRVRNAERLHYAYADAHAVLGEKLAAQGKTREALDHLFKVLNLNPDHIGAHFAVGRIRLEQGRLGEAREHFEEILRRDPENVRARNGLAIVLGKTGQLDASRKMLEELLRDAPDFAEAHYNLAILLLERSDSAGAVEHLRRAVETNPNFTAARRKLEEALANDKGDKVNR
jgi:Flp pilus assembly protein TadD